MSHRPGGSLLRAHPNTAQIKLVGDTAAAVIEQVKPSRAWNSIEPALPVLKFTGKINVHILASVIFKTF
jgi:hypothetical protein